MQRNSSIRDRLKAGLVRASSRLRKRPPVTAEQQLQARIDTLGTKAQELHAECSRLQAEATTFVSRAETTKAPEAPPDRDPLFQRDVKAPPSQYDGQVSAYKMLEAEFANFEAQVGAFGKKLDRFVGMFENLKKSHARPEAPMGRKEHQVSSDLPV